MRLEGTVGVAGGVGRGTCAEKQYIYVEEAEEMKGWAWWQKPECPDKKFRQF